MDTHEAIKFLDRQIPNPSLGLPHEVFQFISRMTPMVNVDLLIKDEKGRMLLSWRNDELNGSKWHIPGGIIRFKERMEHRIKKVAETEIGTPVEFDPVPIAINQIISKQNIRGHNISLLFKCFLSGTYIPKNIGLKKNDNGYLKWHDFCPKNLVKVQEIYRKYMETL